MSAVSQAALIFQRQVRAATADPGPSFVLPMMPSVLMLVVFSSQFDVLARLPGFVASGHGSAAWDAFLLPGVAVLVAMLGAGYTSASLAADVRSGYAERLSLAGVGAGPHLGGRLLFEAVRLVPGAVVVIGLGFAFGGRADNGVAGVVVMVALIALLGVAFSGIFYVVAVASEDPQTPFTMQPLGLPLAFLSSALVPLSIMPSWSEAVARANPVSVVVDAARDSMLGELWSTELAAALAVLAGWTVLTQIAAYRVLTRKLTRG